MNKKKIILTFILGLSVGILFTALISMIPAIKYDVNRDGKVTLADAVKIVNYYTEHRN